MIRIARANLVGGLMTVPSGASQYGTVVRKAFFIIALGFATAANVSEAAAQNRPIRFWNLTKNTISEFYLAPTGTSDWGPNQCKNDKDGRVDFDERLRISDLPPGIYDARFTDVTGRTCTVQNIEIDSGAIISIAEKDLTSCEHH
jgi:hypothetical protein